MSNWGRGPTRSQMEKIDAAGDAWSILKRSGGADHLEWEAFLERKKAEREGRFRDALRDALESGVSKNALYTYGGISRATIDKYLEKLGLNEFAPKKRGVEPW